MALRAGACRLFLRSRTWNSPRFSASIRTMKTNPGYNREIIKDDQYSNQILPELAKYSRLAHQSILSNNLQDTEEILTAMQQKKLKPPKAVLEALIRAFSQQTNSIKVAEYTKKFIHEGYTLEIHLINDIIRTYIDMGAIHLASKAFHQAIRLGIRPNLFTFEILSTGLFNEKQYAAILALLQVMNQYQVAGNQAIYETVLQCYIALHKPNELLQILQEMKAKRIFTSKEIDFTIQEFFASKYLIKHAEKFIGESTSTKANAMLIKGYLGSDNIHEAERQYIWMKQKKIMMSSDICKYFIDYYVRNGLTKQCFRYFNDIPKNFKESPALFIFVLEKLIEHGYSAMVPNILERFKKKFDLPNVVRVYNIRIGSELSVFREDNAEAIFNEMKENGLQPNIGTYNIFLESLTNHTAPSSHWGRIEALWNELLADKLTPTKETFLYLIRYAMYCSDYPRIEKYFTMLMNDFPEIPSLEIYDRMIQYHAPISPTITKQLMEKLIATAEDIPDRDVYNCIIGGYASSHDAQNATDWYQKLVTEQFQPSLKTFNYLLEVQGYHSNAMQASRFLHEMNEYGIEPNTQTYNALILCYARLGDITNTLHFFSRMGPKGLQPDRKTFELIIAAYYRANFPRAAEKFAAEVGFTYNVKKLSSVEYFL